VKFMHVQGLSGLAKQCLGFDSFDVVLPVVFVRSNLVRMKSCDVVKLWKDAVLTLS
jgi:hypothetical protein